MARIDVGAADDFAEGEKRVLDVNGLRMLFSRYKGRVYAVQGKCSHQGADFGITGRLSGNVLHCRMHGANFDLTNGEPIDRSGLDDLIIYRVEERDGRVLVEL
jgi:nitrite reductase/ring-hydroxylating ferredoxin subunit